MQIRDLYSIFRDQFLKHGLKIKDLKDLDHDIKLLIHLAEEWDLDLGNVHRWMKSQEYNPSHKTALHFMENANTLVLTLENIFGGTLHGDLLLSPSFMRFDGFARYDSGHHKVIFGVDHPDADLPYLKVLLAHELSHVFRDHQPHVWGFLGKPLKQISRAEYLDNFSAEEHLVSEGLATLFSQAVFPEVPVHVHHYYSQEEMQWCFNNEEAIGKAIIECLKTDKDVWKFYQPDIVLMDSPSRVQYFWAARRLADWLTHKTGTSFLDKVICALKEPTSTFEIFRL